jgi:hypothetical protein
MLHIRFRKEAVLARYVTAFCCFTAFLLAIRGHAQLAGTGNIQGTVTDSSGALVPNATVTLIEASTQVKRTTVSDQAGVYVFPNIESANPTTSR